MVDGPSYDLLIARDEVADLLLPHEYGGVTVDAIGNFTLLVLENDDESRIQEVAREALRGRGTSLTIMRVDHSLAHLNNIRRNYGLQLSTTVNDLVFGAQLRIHENCVSFRVRELNEELLQELQDKFGTAARAVLSSPSVPLGRGKPQGR